MAEKLINEGSEAHFFIIGDEIYDTLAEKGIKIMLDMTRIAENAYFIQQKEEGYRLKTIAEIDDHGGRMRDRSGLRHQYRA